MVDNQKTVKRERNLMPPQRTTYLEIDLRAIVFDEFFCKMRDRELGAFVRELAKQTTQGKTEFSFPQRSAYPLVRKVRQVLTYSRAALPTPLREIILSVGKCGKCGATEKLTVDHVIPYSRGGETVLENLQCLCKSCNSRKGAR